MPPSTLEKATKDAQKVKALWVTTLSKAEQLVVMIKNKELKYAWANNDENLGELERRKAAMLDGMDSFGRSFLIHDFKTVKQTLAPARLEVFLTEFIKKKVLCEHLSDWVDRVVQRSNLT